MGALLEVKDLTVEWYTPEGYIRAVDGVSFSLNEGEVVGLVGESGAGKSSIAQAILGLVRSPHKVSGRIIYKGRDVLKLTEQELTEYRWKAVSVVFQAAMNVLDPVQTVEENFYTLLKDKGVVKDKKENREKVLELLKKVRLPPHVAKLYPHQLSGGMKQRVVIAMAIATNPDILIADEPTTALDVITQFSILDLLRSLVDSRTIRSMLLISHDLSVHAYVSDKIMVMYRGTIVEKGKKEDVLKTPLHPYSQLLVSNISIESKGLRHINYGDVSARSLTMSYKGGCAFAAMCPYATTTCMKMRPPLIEVDKDHDVACFLYGAKRGPQGVIK